MPESRTCPQCLAPLNKQTSHHVEVDTCPTCKGLWLDHGEFDALVARRFIGHDAEYDMAHNSFVKAEDVLHCPVDQGPMVGVEFDHHDLDYCPQCKGVWVNGADRIELAKQAAEHPLEEKQIKLPRKEGSEYPVKCSGCGEEVPVRSTIHVKDQYYCEKCFVSGNFKDLEDEVARLIRGQRMRSPEERRHLLHGSDHYPTAIKNAIDSLKSLFE